MYNPQDEEPPNLSLMALADLTDLAQQLWDKYHEEGDKGQRSRLKTAYNETATQVNTVRGFDTFKQLH